MVEFQYSKRSYHLAPDMAKWLVEQHGLRQMPNNPSSPKKVAKDEFSIYYQSFGVFAARIGNNKVALLFAIKYPPG